jgi:hypothetical protein
MLNLTRFIFLVGLEFEFRASCLQAGALLFATPSVYLALDSFGDGGLMNYLPGLVLNRNPPYLSLLGNVNHWHLATFFFL